MATERRPTGRAGTVHKVLNNNVVISVDTQGRERVLMGRGLGFGLAVDDVIDLARVEKTFVLDPGEQGDRELRILTDVPYPVIEAVSNAVDDAERRLGRHLGRRLAIPVVDHVQFVLERLDRGVRVPATHMPELRILHPEEFAAATVMAESIGAALERSMPPEEAVFLTMHLLNATRDEPNGTAALLFRRVQHVAATVENGLGVTLDVESADYARFVLHVQFLLQRLVSKSMLRSSDSSFFNFAKKNYPSSYRIAEKVKEYVRVATGSELTTEELLYLIVHVERLASHVGVKDPTAQDDGGHADDVIT